MQQKLSPSLLSPSSSSSNSSFATDSPVPSTSKALQTSRKLKNLIDEDPNSAIRKKLRIKTEPESDCELEDYAAVYQTESAEAQNEDTKNTSSEIIGWTREEDKLILESIQNGLTKQDLLKTLKNQLTTRSQDECEERYEFLMNFLIKMKKDD